MQEEYAEILEKLKNSKKISKEEKNLIEEILSDENWDILARKGRAYTALHPFYGKVVFGNLVKSKIDKKNCEVSLPVGYGTIIIANGDITYINKKK
ncbi:MAG: hypothetical protein PHG82_04545 [Candidatus Gracilibacteria bacterium]|nr:hypothetical protein [Candidatus Gracilibacteria bacterium]